MTNSLWVILQMLWKADSSQLFLWPIVCEWHCTCCESSLIASFPMANRKWVTLHILWKQSHHILSYDQQEVSDIVQLVKGTSFPRTNSKWVTLHMLCKTISSHLFQWPTGSEWHCTFCEGNVITSFPMTNSEWVEQQVSDITHLVKASLIMSCHMTNRKWETLHILWKALNHMFLWPTAGGWHCTFFVKGSVITSFPMTTACEWYS